MSLKELMQNPLSQITDSVYLTGVIGVKRPDLMRSVGITHVLNVAAGDLAHLHYDLGKPRKSCTSEDEFADPALESNCGPGKAPDLVVRREDLRDSEDQSLLPYLDDLVDFVADAVRAGGKVVVHCVAGVSRSASVVLAYLVREHGMTLREAHDHVIARRPVVNPNMGFWIALVEYERNVRGENSVELLNYVCGKVPSLESYKKEMYLRIRLGWMDHLFYNLFVQICILIAQMIGSLWIFSDYY